MQPLPSEIKFSPTLLSPALSHPCFAAPPTTLLPIPEPKTTRAEQRAARIPLAFPRQGCKHLKSLNPGRGKLGTHNGTTVRDLLLCMANLLWIYQGSLWATIKCLQAAGQFVPGVYFVLGLCSFASAAQDRS